MFTYSLVKLLDEGKLNLDDPVQKYVPKFPEKQINSKPCVITIRHLLCHQSGIRHYHERKKDENSDGEKCTKVKYYKLTVPCYNVYLSNLFYSLA